MRRIIGVAWLLLLGFFLLPLLLLSQPEAEAEDEPAPTATLPLDKVLVEEVVGVDDTTTVDVLLEDGTVETMTVANYLWGVVAAEMPASFEVEALKAQAVATRTYLISKMDKGSVSHPEADICTDYTCCQAYTSPETAQGNWGEDAAVYTQKIADAISATDGLALFYEGEPIEAVFHSSSAGQTVDAVAVWGTDVPYLVGVESPEGEGVPNYQSTVTFTPEEFSAIILAAYPQADLSGAVEDWCDAITYDTSGMVESMVVGTVSMGGNTLRTLLGLRSAHFTLSASGEEIAFFVTGYGHGVGMSQYGANALAGTGMSCEEILLWYYTGVEVVYTGASS